MKIADIRARAFAMPLNDPSYPPGPYRFFDREYMVISYRTNLDVLRALVPEPLEVTEPIVKYEFIRMPDSAGFGDYTETGQVIPVSLYGEKGVFVHSVYLDDDAPIAGGREIWAFPRNWRSRSSRMTRRSSSARFLTATNTRRSILIRFCARSTSRIF